MSYDGKKLVRMTFPSHDFGAGAEVLSFYLPPNEHGEQTKGRVVNVGVMAITEAFANSTGGGTIQIGTATDNDAYAKLNIPDETADEACVDINTDADVIISEDISAGQLVEINCTQSTDADTAAGIGIPFVDFYVW